MRKALLIATVATMAALAFVAFAPGAAAGTGTQADPFGPGDKVDICHYDGSDNGGGGSGKYNQPNPSTTGTGPAGHIGHAFDVIPSYYFQQNANAQVEFYAGVNWPTLTNLPSSPVDFTPLIGSSASAFIAGGCAAPVTTTSTTTVTTSTVTTPTSTTPPPTTSTATTTTPTSTVTTTTATTPPPTTSPPPTSPPPSNPPNHHHHPHHPNSPRLAFTGPDEATGFIQREAPWLFAFAGLMLVIGSMLLARGLLLGRDR